MIKTKITSLVIGLILGAGLGLYGNIDDDVMAAKTDSQTTKTVKQAKSLSQQYQYKEAKSVLSGHKGTTVDHLKKSINKQQSKLVTWHDPTKISHLFYHSLIVDPGKAFSSKQAQGYKDYMVTIDEFMPMLNQLYDNGYVVAGDLGCGFWPNFSHFIVDLIMQATLFDHNRNWYRKKLKEEVDICQCNRAIHRYHQGLSRSGVH